MLKVKRLPRPTPPALHANVWTTVSDLYVYDIDRHFVVKPSSVSKAVSVALGISWSPKLGAIVRDAVEAIGGKMIINRERLWAYIRPRGVNRVDAYRQSTQLRTITRKRWLR